MNTAVGNSFDIGWKLAAVFGGYGGSRLLSSTERTCHCTPYRSFWSACGGSFSMVRMVTVRTQAMRFPLPKQKMEARFAHR
jgi:hypothetical protein